jgi:hypothetical protein
LYADFRTDFNAGLQALEQVLEKNTAQQYALRITVPVQNAGVPERQFVQGTVSDPKATVWVIVHPMEISSY